MSKVMSQKLKSSQQDWTFTRPISTRLCFHVCGYVKKIHVDFYIQFHLNEQFMWPYIRSNTPRGRSRGGWTLKCPSQIPTDRRVSWCCSHVHPRRFPLRTPLCHALHLTVFHSFSSSSVSLTSLCGSMPMYLFIFFGHFTPRVYIFIPFVTYPPSTDPLLFLWQMPKIPPASSLFFFAFSAFPYIERRSLMPGQVCVSSLCADRMTCLWTHAYPLAFKAPANDLQRFSVKLTHCHFLWVWK